MAILYTEGYVSVGVIYILCFYFGNGPEPFISHDTVKVSTRSLACSASPGLGYHSEEEKKLSTLLWLLALLILETF